MTAAPDHSGAALVTLGSYPTEFAAHTVVAVLAAHDIDALCIAPTSLDVSITTGRPKPSIVQVRADDVERARTVLHENAHEAEQIDWDTVDIGAREDDPPPSTGPHQTGRMPLPAKLAFAIACALVLLGMLAAVLAALA